MQADRSRSSPPVEPLALAVGRRLAALRATAGMSLQEIGGLTGMSAAYVWRVEAGRQNLSLRNIARFANAFGLSLSELLSDVDARLASEGNRPYSAGS